MKITRKGVAWFFMTYVAIVGLLYLPELAATAAGTIARMRGTYVIDVVQTPKLRVGTTTSQVITNVHYACDCATDGVSNSCGTWSSRSTSTSSAGTFTVSGALVGDACVYIPGTTVSSGGQALDWRCEVSTTDTVKERVTNASGGSLTPTQGKHCALTFTPGT